jgi:MFS family permease
MSRKHDSQGVSKPAGAGAREANPQRRFAALHSRNFRNLWIGLVVANAGGQMQNASVAWLIRDIYGGPIYLGLLSLSFAVPMILLTPLGGAVADRVPRLRLLRLTQVGFFLQPLAMSLVIFAGYVDLWVLLLLRFLYGVLLALDNPVRQALLPDLVERDHLPSAVSLSTVAWTGSALIGPAVAGLLIEPIGVGGVLVITTLSALASIAAVFTFRNLPPDSHQPQGSLTEGLTQGLSYAVRQPVVATLLLLVWAENLLGRSYQALMPIFARDVLGGGPQEYGLLLAAPGAGSLVGGVGLAGMTSVKRHDRVMIAGWFGFTVALILFGLSQSLVLSWMLLFFTAACATLINASVATLLQLRLPSHLRGRVMSLVSTANIGGSNLGGMGSAAAASYVGAQAAVAGGAALLLSLGAFLTWRGRGKLVDAG